jgi:hypothetical protein
MHADAWAALAQWVTAAIALGAAVFAYFQVVEARRTRERVAQPDVVVYVDHHEIRRYMDLVVKNFGQTTAYNVRLILPPLKVAPFRSRITAEMVDSLALPKSIAVLAPGQEWRTVWDSAVRRAKHIGELETQFVGRVEFDDKIVSDKPSYNNPVSLDINMFWNTTWIQRSESRTVKDALYNIAGTLEGFTDQRHGVWVYPVSSVQERQRRTQEAADDEAAFDAVLHDIGGAQESEPDTDDED